MTVIQGWREDGGSRLWRIEHGGDYEVQDGIGQHKYMNAAATACECKEVSVTEVAGSVYDLPSIEAVIRYLHASLGFPTKNTLLRAIKHGNLSSFPGLTVNTVTKYFPESDETQKGHMRQS